MRSFRIISSPPMSPFPRWSLACAWLLCRPAVAVQMQPDRDDKRRGKAAVWRDDQVFFMYWTNKVHSWKKHVK